MIAVRGLADRNPAGVGREPLNRRSVGAGSGGGRRAIPRSRELAFKDPFDQIHVAEVFGAWESEGANRLRRHGVVTTGLPERLGKRSAI